MANMPDARDARISELETMVEDLQDTVQRQQDTIFALQQTNELISEQMEETSKQLQSSNQQFLAARGLYSASDGDLLKSLSIDQTVDQIDYKLQSNAVNQDDVYSSGDDIETYKTEISDDHELLPLKQGTLKKKSETMHRYNNRYVILYPSFLLYYDQCPIKTEDRQINHPKGSIYLRNYHVSIRKDTKYDITFVPHSSAVSMGLAAMDARLRFRCKNIEELTDWSDKIRTAITSANSGFIKYDIGTDFIYNDLSNLGKVCGNNNEKNSRMFDINDLKEMFLLEEERRNEIEIKDRLICKLEHELQSLNTDLAMKTTEVESEQTVFERQKKDLMAKMEDIKEHENTLKEEISHLRATITSCSQRQMMQHKKIKEYKYNEEDILGDIAIIQKWNKKMDENSLQFVGGLYPNSSNKQLLENCEKGCVVLLEEFNNIEIKKGKICREMMSCFTHLFRKHIKITINYANLQHTHHGVVEDVKLLKKSLYEYENDDSNTLEHNAMIMASMTASLF